MSLLDPLSPLHTALPGTSPPSSTPPPAPVPRTPRALKRLSLSSSLTAPRLPPSPSPSTPASSPTPTLTSSNPRRAHRRISSIAYSPARPASPTAQEAPIRRSSSSLRRLSTLSLGTEEGEGEGAPAQEISVLEPQRRAGSTSFTPGTPSDVALTFIEQHAPLLHIIAQKESLIAELRSELSTQESELASLKNQFTSLLPSSSSASSTTPFSTSGSAGSPTSAHPPPLAAVVEGAQAFWEGFRGGPDLPALRKEDGDGEGSPKKKSVGAGGGTAHAANPSISSLTSSSTISTTSSASAAGDSPPPSARSKRLSLSWAEQLPAPPMSLQSKWGSLLASDTFKSSRRATLNFASHLSTAMDSLERQLSTHVPLPYSSSFLPPSTSTSSPSPNPSPSFPNSAAANPPDSPSHPSRQKRTAAGGEGEGENGWGEWGGDWDAPEPEGLVKPMVPAARAVRGKRGKENVQERKEEKKDGEEEEEEDWGW